ncbi:6075_t:CDS:2 [Gigaspora rosea]|nr:6075_t:CDS:2 [Gigaspora rosea]
MNLDRFYRRRHLERKNEVVVKSILSKKTPRGKERNIAKCNSKKNKKQKPQTLATNLDQFHQRKHLERKSEVVAEYNPKKNEKTKAMNSRNELRSIPSKKTQLHNCNPKKNKKTKALNSSNEFRLIPSKKSSGGKK